MTPFPWQQQNAALWQRQQGRYGHAYLLTGVDGLGLTEFARAMAQGLLCENSTESACGQCAACIQFGQDSHPDFVQLEVLEGKKEIGVDQVRQLSQRLMQTSHQGGYKVALLQQVESFNSSAFNALLKTLEEPPEQTILILTTYQLNRLPATIVSRCQQLTFTPPSMEDSQAWLQQQLPHLDATLLKRALRLNWGAPLAALNWLNEQGWQWDDAWQKDLQSLRQGSQAVTQVVANWLKWPQPEQVFDQFYLASVTAIRRAFYQQQIPLNQAWFDFQQRVLQAKLDWLQNANKELLLEALCMTFLQVEQGLAIRQSVFESEWIRGRWA